MTVGKYLQLSVVGQRRSISDGDQCGGGQEQTRETSHGVGVLIACVCKYVRLPTVVVRVWCLVVRVLGLYTRNPESENCHQSYGGGDKYGSRIGCPPFNHVFDGYSCPERV